MVKKEYCENESFYLAWDHIKVCQMNLYITTKHPMIYDSQ